MIADWWTDAVNRLKEDRPVPVYIRFALDATYFAQHDPTRGIIMACAAWETALKHYLANVASKPDPAYRLASDIRGLHHLRRFAETARGCPLFRDEINLTHGDQRELLEHYRQQMDGLPTLRNKLLHEGKPALREGAAQNAASAVLSAIEWLFAGSNR